jgi:GNAT superfamily N-acetyltransferase
MVRISGEHPRKTRSRELVIVAQAGALRPQPVAPAIAPDIEIRVLNTVEELIESYRLRYDVYGALGYIQRFNKYKLEIDEYDAASIPFGAFDLVSGRMIGTLRLITNSRRPIYERLIRRVVNDFADAELAKQALGPRPRRLPSIISDKIARQIEVFNTDHFAVQELSRFIVHPSYRGSGVSRGLMEFGLANASHTAPTLIVSSCLPEHLPMNAKYGYMKLPQTGLERFDSVGQVANGIVCRTDRLPHPTRNHVDALLHSMKSGATECMLEIGRDSHALYRFAGTSRARRRTLEW